MTSAADDARRLQRRRPMRDHGRPRRRAAPPARVAPRPGSRAPPRSLPPGSTAWSSTTPAGTPPSPAAPPAAARRRASRLTSASIPHPPGRPRPSSLMRGVASPSRRRTTPCQPGSPSPVARPRPTVDALGQACPHHAAGRARLHYVERETRVTGTRTRPRNGHRPGAAPQHARSQAAALAHPRQAGHTSASRSKNPSSGPGSQNHQRAQPTATDPTPACRLPRPRAGEAWPARTRSRSATADGSRR